jgi:hypothetical protein
MAIDLKLSPYNLFQNVKAMKVVVQKKTLPQFIALDICTKLVENYRSLIMDDENFYSDVKELIDNILEQKKFFPFINRCRTFENYFVKKYCR